MCKKRVSLGCYYYDSIWAEMYGKKKPISKARNQYTDENQSIRLKLKKI